MYAMDFTDRNKQRKAKAKCEHSVPHMVEQLWSVHNDGTTLYLELQENIAAICTGDAQSQKVFRGAARRLWCIFLQHGVRDKVFNKTTPIELEARGWLPSARCDKEELSKTIPALVKFYEKLGFHKFGVAKQCLQSPKMRSTVGVTLATVCKASGGAGGGASSDSS